MAMSRAKILAYHAEAVRHELAERADRIEEIALGVNNPKAAGEQATAWRRAR